MTTVYTKQYRPLSANDTGTNDALSVRAIRDLSESVNNAKAHVLAHKIRHIACIPPWQSELGTNDQRVIMCFAPFWCPLGYRKLKWQMGHRRIAGADVQQVTWRLYAGSKLYVGPAVLDTNYLGYYSMDYAISGSDTHDFFLTGSLDITQARGANGLVWLTLTALPLSTGAQSEILSMDMELRLS